MSRATLHHIRVVCLGFLIGTVHMACGQGEVQLEAATEQSLLIRGARLVLPAEGRTTSPRDVLVVDGRIARVGPAGEISEHRGATVIEAQGRFLMPGLIDVHAHIGDGGLGEQGEEDRRAALEQFLRYGVTSVFVPGGGAGNDHYMQRWKQLCASGELRCPRIFGSGALITAPGSHPISTIWHFSEDVDADTLYARGAVVVAEDEPVQALLEGKRAMGVDGIKIVIEDWGGECPRLSKAKIAELTRTAHALSLPVFAHISMPQHAKDAVAAGVDGLMHSAEAAISDSTLAAMARRGVYYVATLALYDGFFDLAAGRRQQEAYAVSGVSPRALRSLEGPRQSPFTRAQAIETEAVVEANLRRAARAGVPLALGTDVNNPGVFPGYSAHEELALMVKSGLEPAQALTAATLGGAGFLGRESSLGRIEPGFQADLLLLAGNPLVDIRNTRTLVEVIVAGRLVTGIVSDSVVDSRDSANSVLQPETGGTAVRANAG